MVERDAEREREREREREMSNTRMPEAIVNKNIILCPSRKKEVKNENGMEFSATLGKIM